MTEKNRVCLYKKNYLSLPHEFYQAVLTLTVQDFISNHIISPMFCHGFFLTKVVEDGKQNIS